MQRFYPVCFLVVILLVIIPFLAEAQKLPKIQEGSVWAPDDIKIDGNLSEWNDQLKAYNVANPMYYTVSNNDEYLYLTLRMNRGVGSNKVMRGGITFTITSPSKSSAVSVRYPLRIIGQPLGKEQLSEEKYKALYSNPIAHKKEIDELVSESNKMIKDYRKDILVKGFPGVSDTLISIYNQEGIHVAGLYNPQMEYTYELAIPLKYLGDDINKGQEFAYNIKFGILGIRIGPEPVQKEPLLVLQVAKRLAPPSPNEMYSYTETDFSGKYTLAKKQ